MIYIATPENDSLYKDQMDQAYRLRQRVFLEQQGWAGLAYSDGCALDEFDNKNAVHMLYVDEGEVLGYQRLLPTTSPHLLSDVFPELCMGSLQLEPISGRCRTIASPQALDGASIRRAPLQARSDWPWLNGALSAGSRILSSRSRRRVYSLWYNSIFNQCLSVCRARSEGGISSR